MIFPALQLDPSARPDGNSDRLLGSLVHILTLKPHVSHRAIERFDRYDSYD